jgi:hypothetical protein
MGLPSIKEARRFRLKDSLFAHLAALILRDLRPQAANPQTATNL